MKKILSFCVLFFAFVFILEAEPYARRRIPGHRNRDQEGYQDRSSNKKEDGQLPMIHFKLPGDVILSLVRIPAGSFIFSAADGKNWAREKEVHVTLKNDYYIGMFEVTQAQYKAVIGRNPSHRKDGAEYPVENVSWNDAMFFCERLTKYRAPKGWRFTLPTECQWEYAARAGASSGMVGKVQHKNRHRKTRGGYMFSGSDELTEVGWFDDNAGNKSHPVGQKAPNEFGLYDMSGNVWEWCLDNWTNDSRKVVPEFYRDNELDFREPRMMRGGGYRNGENFCRVAFRQYKEASFRYRTMGFRVALVPLPNNPNPKPEGNYDPEE